MGLYLPDIDLGLELIKKLIKDYEDGKLPEGLEPLDMIIIPEMLTDEDKRKIQDNISLIKKATEYGMGIYIDENELTVKSDLDKVAIRFLYKYDPSIHEILP